MVGLQCVCVGGLAGGIQGQCVLVWVWVRVRVWQVQHGALEVHGPSSHGPDLVRNTRGVRRDTFNSMQIGEEKGCIDCILYT